MSLVAAVLVCLVVGVSDGDTLTGRCTLEGGQVETVKIRLAEVDAPEKGQAFGDRSKEHLAALCFGHKAHVQVDSTDRYGRSVAHIQCEGRDAGAEQVRAGMAWVFDQYARDKSLYRLQETAQNARAGLWQDAKPVSPWAWRKARRTGAQEGESTDRSPAP